MDSVTELSEEVVAMGSHMFKVRLPFLSELRNYSVAKAKADLIAAATVTLVSIPQAIGFSLILNLPPGPVIASVVIGGFVGALFFSSHQHVFGPTSSISLIVAATIAANAPAGLPPLELAIYMAFLIGMVQLLAGLLNFGEVTKFISRSVVVGYSTGIGVMLIASQLHNLLGYAVEAGQNFSTNVLQALFDLGTAKVHFWDMGIGVLTFAIFWLVKRLRPHWPEALIGLAALGIAARVFTIYFAGPPPFRMVRDEGALTAVIPAFAGYPFGPRRMHLLPELAGTAIAISILGMLEAASITKGLAAKSGQKIEPNQELVGMGVANIACAFFGAVPGSSSFARSAVNYQSGARTQMASMMSSLVVLAALAWVTPVFNFIPVAALAAHLIRVGFKMINRRMIRVCCRSTPSDLVVFVVTLSSCLLLKLDTAIYVGIGVSLVLFLRKTSTPTLVEYAINESGNLAELSDPTQRPHPQISIIHVEGELFFGAADLFQEQIRLLADNQNIRVFILRMKNARHLDASTVLAMESLHDYLRQTGRHLLVSGSNREVTQVLENSGLLALIGRENIFPAEVNPTVSTRNALRRAKELLPNEALDVRVFYDRKQSPI